MEGALAVDPSFHLSDVDQCVLASMTVARRDDHPWDMFDDGKVSDMLFSDLVFVLVKVGLDGVFCFPNRLGPLKKHTSLIPVSCCHVNPNTSHLEECEREEKGTASSNRSVVTTSEETPSESLCIPVLCRLSVKFPATG